MLSAFHKFSLQMLIMTAQAGTIGSHLTDGKTEAYRG